MKRKIIKMFNGKKPVSLWRITFVKRGVVQHLDFYKSHLGKPIPDWQITETLYNTYFCFAPDFPTALNKLHKFVSKLDWDVYGFERFKEIDYNLIYKL